MAGRVVLGIRLRFHHHAPKQLARGLAFHQEASDEVGGDLLGGRAKKAWGRAGRSSMAFGVA